VRVPDETTPLGSPLALGLQPSDRAEPGALAVEGDGVWVDLELVLPAGSSVPEATAATSARVAENDGVGPLVPLPCERRRRSSPGPCRGLWDPSPWRGRVGDEDRQIGVRQRLGHAESSPSRRPSSSLLARVGSVS